jgi:DNA-binding MarR family transcriptional regulator
MVQTREVVGVETGVSQLAHLLNRTRRHELVKSSSGLPLDRAAMVVLRQLDETGPARPSDLADALHVEGPHVTRQVHILERHGFAERRADPADGRAQLVTLTRAGRAAAKRLRDASRAALAEALSGWSREDLQQLGDLLLRMVDDFRAHAEAPEALDRAASA